MRTNMRVQDNPELAAVFRQQLAGSGALVPPRFLMDGEPVPWP